MDHHSIHAIVEIGNSSADSVASGLKVAKAIGASEAFRKYNWIKDVPVLNQSGNFRGMVISKRWASIFHFADSALKPIEKVAIVAALAENIVAVHREIDKILGSNDGWDVKTARLSTQVSSVMIRTVAGSIPAGAHILATSIGGYCQLAGLAGFTNATELAKKLSSMDTSFSSRFNKVTDGENINVFINKYLIIK